MEFWIKAAQLILSLSILVTLHEFGHFLPARLFKIRVEKFYLFFNPWFSLFKYKRGETEWGLGWLPLGGYVKIAGMVDESMDKEQMKQPPQPWEFRSKPTWQRLIVMIGGVTVNLFLGFLIYMMVLFMWGRDELPVQNVKYGITADSLAQECGLRPGDKILSVEGDASYDFGKLNRAIMFRGVRNLTVERGGEKVRVELPDDVKYRMNEIGARELFTYRFPCVVDSVAGKSPAEKAGIKKGDHIILLNDHSVAFYDEFVETIKEYKGKPVTLSLLRDGDTIVKTVNPDKDNKIGFYPAANPEKLFKTRHIDYGFFESIPAGIGFGVETLGDYVNSLSLLFTSSGAKQLGGFGTIGSMFSAEWNWERFWMLTAFLSIVLAFMNILPIPALDGGHVMFLLWEMITGRQPNQRVMEIAQIAGMVLLIGLILFANANDIIRLF